MYSYYHQHLILSSHFQKTSEFYRFKAAAENRHARNRSGGHVSSAATNSTEPSPPSRRSEKAPTGRGSPEGGALWCPPHRRPPARAGVQRAEPFGAARRGPGSVARPGGGVWLALSAQDRPLRRRTSISEGNSIQHWKFRLIWSILGVTTVKVEERV